MSRDPGPPESGGEPPPEPAGHVRPTAPGPLVGLWLVGLVLVWLLRRTTGWATTVSWLPVLGLLLAAAILGAVAWSTHRALHRRREWIEPHRAVNRLVLAKAAALAGALVSGGYLGYALSWWQVAGADLAGERALRSAVAGVAGLLIVAGALLLERACRVHRDPADP